MLHQLSLSKKRGVQLDQRANLARIGRFVMIVVFLASLVGVPTRPVNAAATITFTGGELLGKPTDTSIAINIVPATTIEYHYQYGATSGVYTGETANVTATGGQPHEVTIEGLTPNTRYFYRMQYHAPGDAMNDWVNRNEYSFWTQRAAGSSFVFTVESDSHANMNTSHQNAMTNVFNEDPDFHIDLGDTFYPQNAANQNAVDQRYLAYRDPLYMGRIGPSVPIFLAAGNHEDEEGWNLDDTPFSPAVGSIQARKAYYPTPIDDGFYSANTNTLSSINEATYGDEFREDYYAWTWGDALFVVIDEFQYTMQNPYGATAGEGSDDPITGDQWNWTLGAEQYNWLRETLEGSDAKYKFVFSHNMLGGIPRDIGVNTAGYVRGGAEAAGYFEWGGKNADGTAGFASHRDPAVFGTKPIHQLFVENGVSAYFHGHDHQYVYETRDGIVYQEVPSPSMTGSGFSGIYTEGTYAEYQTIEMLPNAGHLRVSVTPTQATVDYISASNTSGAVNYTYNITPSVVGPTYTLTTAVSPAGSGTITPSAGENVLAEGAVVDVTAAPAAGYVFSSWSGACSGSGACQVTMDADKTVTANFVENGSAARQDGAVSTATGDDVSTLSWSHTTGTGENPLMLVGISWNSGTAATSVSSVTFEGQALSQVGVLQYPDQNRYTAIYSLLAPASGVTGTVAITFSASISNGIVAGAANFAGVDQTTPLGTFVTATGTSSTQPSLELTGLAGNELVFDSLFAGGNPAPTLTVDASQTQLWNTGIANTSGGASIEQAAGSSVTMSWTRSGTNYWAIAAVPIHPAASATTYNLTVAANPADAGTTSPSVGVHVYAEGSTVNVTASPAAGYVFSSWSGACTGSGTCSVTMDADKSVTANFTEDLTPKVQQDGAVSSATGDDVSTLSWSHTTGTGANRLMLVGASWNSGTTATSISSVTFEGQALSVVGTLQYPSQNRYTAIYSLLAPASGVSGTLSITFSASISNGIVAGAANFAEVDQTTPLGSFVTATGTDSTQPSVAVPGLAGNELVFDSLFAGGNPAPVLTVDPSQTMLWAPTGIANTSGGASIEQAAGSSVTMSWTRDNTNYWAIGAVPIRPAVGGTTHDLTIAVNPTGAGTTSPSVGVHAYAEGSMVNVTASPAAGYIFASWGGACSGSGACQVTMDADKSVTANFTAAPTYVLTTAVNPTSGGTITPSAGTHTYTSGTVVNVTVSPASGYQFDSWSGACTGTGACSVTMDADKSVTANFSLIPVVVTFTGTELLGRPTSTSIAVSAIPDQAISLRYQYSTTSGGPYTATAAVAAPAGVPTVVTISGLASNTHYYYRMQYSSDGGTTWTSRPEHDFYTQRAAGSTFSFTITSDSHVNIMLGSGTTWTNTLNDIAAANPDFAIDLGDTAAMDDGNNSVSSAAEAEQVYLDTLPYFNIISGSSPVYMVAGNHEQQEGWHLYDPLADSLPVIGTNAQNKYFLNPAPDGFYTGSSSTYSYLAGDQLRRNYYAWTWGDALFVTIDPYWFSTTKPYTTTVGGGEGDTTGSGDRWDWTLGLEQFNWLKDTLENSEAKYKFIFAHQIVGGNSLSSPNQVNYGHGGVDSANLVEWGGYNVGGTVWAWDTERPGWGSQPIHQMMVSNGVTAFFHGHDHQYAYEMLDGIVYQSVPSGGFTQNFGIYTTGGNDGKTIQALTSTGHLKVTVGPTQTSVDYMRTGQATSAYTYTMAPTGGPRHTLTVAADPSGAGTTNPAVGTYSYMQGSVVNVTATPAAGYQFDHWSGACTGSGTCAVTIDADKSVTAHFTQIEYTLTIVSEHGTVTKTPNQTTYHYGDVVTLSATAAAGWTFTGWTPALTNNQVTITSNTSVTANYTQNEYTLTVISDHGTVTKSPYQATYHYGDVVTLSATAADGWTFSGWTPALTGNQVTITGNMTVTANYTQNEYTLTVISEHGTVTKTPNQATYHYGDVVTLSATAADGWTFSGWTPTLTGNQVTITSNTSVTANYTQNEYALTIVSEHGTVTKLPDQATYHYGDVVALSATAAAGWTFTGWTPALTGNQVTITGNMTVTANYTQNEYTLTIISEHGTVTKTPDQATYHYGDTVVLSVTAAPGWNFTGWTPELTGNQVTITSNTTITANYEQTEYTLTIDSSINPSVYGQLVTFTATVTSTGEAPDGMVTFYDGVEALGTVPLDSSGEADLATAALQPGTHSITAEYEGTVGSCSGMLVGGQVVNPVPITITAQALSKVYGETDPALLTYQITSGVLVPGDTLTGTLTRAAGENVGAYPITQGTLTNTNNPHYDITFIGANFTITPRAVAVTANAQTKVYGGADPALPYTFSPALVSGDSFTGGLVRAAGENAGTYAITQGSLALSSNYTLAFTGASFTITRRTIAVTASAQTKVYGSADPALAYTFSPALVTGDSFTGGLVRAAGENAGTYAITQGSLALSSNYTLTFTGASFTITKATLTVTANNQTRKFMEENPAFTYTITGFVRGDTLAVVTGSPVLTTTATKSSPIGEYPITITAGSLQAANYNFIMVNGKLTITENEFYKDGFPTFLPWVSKN